MHQGSFGLVTESLAFSPSSGSHRDGTISSLRISKITYIYSVMFLNKNNVVGLSQYPILLPLPNGWTFIYSNSLVDTHSVGLMDEKNSYPFSRGALSTCLNSPFLSQLSILLPLTNKWMCLILSIRWVRITIPLCSNFPLCFLFQTDGCVQSDVCDG